MVATVGEDFKMDEIGFLKDRSVDLSGIEVDEGKPSAGKANTATTLIRQ